MEYTFLYYQNLFYNLNKSGAILHFFVNLSALSTSKENK